jgi:hypothetical protein
VARDLAALHAGEKQTLHQQLGAALACQQAAVLARGVAEAQAAREQMCALWGCCGRQGAAVWGRDPCRPWELGLVRTTGACCGTIMRVWALLPQRH